MTFTLRDANGKIRPNFADLKRIADESHRNNLEFTALMNQTAANGGHNGKF